MTVGLQVLGSRNAELQHRKAARQEKGNVLGAHPTIPQHYIGAGFTELGTQPIFGCLGGKDTTQEKSVDDLRGTKSSKQQPWHTEETADHLPPWRWAREAQGHKTIDVPNWVPLGPRNNMGRDRN